MRAASLGNKTNSESEEENAYGTSLKTPISRKTTLKSQKKLSRSPSKLKKQLEIRFIEKQNKPSHLNPFELMLRRIRNEARAR